MFSSVLLSAAVQFHDELLFQARYCRGILKVEAVGAMVGAKLLCEFGSIDDIDKCPSAGA
jgi:hypothetical protein